MRHLSIGRWTHFILGALVFCLPGIAAAELKFNGIVVFGTSVSDPGNGYELLAHPLPGLIVGSGARLHKPPYDTLDEDLTPAAPYARNGRGFTNGATWIEQLAQARGLAADAGAAFQSGSPGARNYAVGGARATDYPGRVNLAQQIQAFMNDVGYTPSENALYVIEIGNNDVRDAVVKFFEVFADTLDPNEASAAANVAINNALNGIATNIHNLYSLGARKFLILNAARIDRVPAVTAMGPGVINVAANLTNGFNHGLDQHVLAPVAGLPGIQIAQLKVANHMAAIFQSPGSFGLINVTEPCLTPNTPPFRCEEPDNYFFWDGIHPTRAVHTILAQRAAELLARYPGTQTP